MRAHLLRNALLFAGSLFASLAIATTFVAAQQGPPTLVTQAVDNSVRTVLPGNIHPLARAEFDQGEAPPDLPLKRMLLVLKRSDQQEAALRSFIENQQDSRTRGYHQWLTPEEFGANYGPSDSDIAAVTNWLKMSGFEVTSISTGRTVIEFSGTAGLLKQAFGAGLRQYVIKGKQYWANAANPSIPKALSPVVAGLVSLNNFPRKPHSNVLGTFTRKDDGEFVPISLFSFNNQGQPFFGVSPADFAKIYNIPANMDGSGQTIAIVGETNISIQDIRTFRSIFGLPARDPRIILNGPDPGILTNGEETESVLDVSWSGAVATNATIDFVVSASTETTYGIDLSSLYIVDNNLAPVMSESYGYCERLLGNAYNGFYKALWQQAAAQGITVLLSSGDGGSAGCDDFNTMSYAVQGLAVSGFASTPYNVSVGGTDFDQNAGNVNNYWNSTNNPQGESAKSYIRELPWNDSCAGVLFAPDYCTGSNLNYLNIVAGSGGQSTCATQDDSGTCLSGYAKPSWQTGTGVRPDGVRDSPDISLFASNGFNHSFYMLCEADALQGFTCNIGSNYAFLAIGGTSASSPAFAGVMALVNQKTGSRQGNANYVLYKLAAQSGASCDSTALTNSQLTSNSCIFYDTTKGNNAVPCYFSPNCGTPPPGGYGVLVDPLDGTTPAWTTTRGYDMATGLGTVNVANLVNKWTTATFTQSVTTISTLTPVSITHGQPVNVSVTVAPKTGTGTPVGTVALMGTVGGKPLALDNFALANGVAAGTTSLLAGGTYNVTAHYSGDGTYGGSDSAGVQVTVGKENSKTALTLVDQNLNHITTIPYGSLYFLRGDVTNASGTLCNAPVGQLACPTGSAILTDNGAQLDAGTYSVNNQGYFEDYVIDLNVGTHPIQAAYGGDSSFNASTTTQNISITQAATTMYAYAAGQVIVGQSTSLVAQINTQSFGNAPGGTVTFYADGSAVTGTVQLTPVNGHYPTWASLTASIPFTFNTPGNHSITATYSGDTNYAAVTSSAYTADARYIPAYFTLTANPQNVAYGDSLTLTATIGGNSATVAPTGQIAFYGLIGSSTSPVYTTITDNNGFLALQAVVTLTPTYEQTVNVLYFGDLDFTNAQAPQVPIGITDATFGIDPIQAVTISSPGQAGYASLNLTSVKGFLGMVSLTCTLPPAMTEASCPPSTVYVTQNYGYGTLTITTTGPHHVSSIRPLGEGLFGFGVVAGAFLLAIPRSRRKLPITLLLLMLVALIVSCGGSGGGGGGGGGGGHTDPGTPPGTYTANVTATAPGITQTASFSVTVQ